MTSTLKHLIGETVSVVTNDGRNIVGTLRGFDQATNLILESCQERVFSMESGVQQVKLGVYVVRGDNVAIVGEIDKDKDKNIDYSKILAQPLKPIVH